MPRVLCGPGPRPVPCVLCGAARPPAATRRPYFPSTSRPTTKVRVPLPTPKSSSQGLQDGPTHTSTGNGIQQVERTKRVPPARPAGRAAQSTGPTRPRAGALPQQKGADARVPTSIRKSPVLSPACQATPPSSTDSRYCSAGNAGVGVNSSMGVSAGRQGRLVRTPGTPGGDLRGSRWQRAGLAPAPQVRATPSHEAQCIPEPPTRGSVACRACLYVHACHFL